jgi:solute:Na+ symporter, SSS family
MQIIDIVIIAVYFILIFGAGIFFFRWIENPDDFYLAGRRLTPFILAASITATNVNLYSFIGQSGIAYESGISIIWNTWAGNMALVISGLFILPIFRRLRIRTIPEFVGMRYNRGLRILVGIIWVFRLAFWLGIGLYAISIAALTITGIGSFTIWVSGLALVTVMYTLLGGAWSVVLTDTLQFLLMLGGALIILPIAMHAVGGFWGLKAQLPLSHFNFIPQNGSFNWLFVLSMFLISIKWASVDQSILQRGLGSVDVKTAAKGMVWSGIITTPFALLWILPGMDARILYPHLSNFDFALPTLIRAYVPPIALGLVASGFLSAQMSTIGPDLNSIATLFTHDIYNSYLNKTPNDKKTLFIARITIVVVGAFIVGFSYLIPLLGGVVKANLTIVGIMDMPLFVIAVIYGLLWKRANWQGAISAYIIGAVTGILVYLFLGENFNLSTISSAVSALIACPLISLLTAKPDALRTTGIWEMRKADSSRAEDTDSYHIIPISKSGKISLMVLAAGLLLFFVSILLGSLGYSIASLTSIVGMIIFFAGGLCRLFFD